MLAGIRWQIFYLLYHLQVLQKQVIVSSEYLCFISYLCLSLIYVFYSYESHIYCSSVVTEKISIQRPRLFRNLTFQIWNPCTETSKNKRCWRSHSRSNKMGKVCNLGLTAEGMGHSNDTMQRQISSIFVQLKWPEGFTINCCCVYILLPPAGHMNHTVHYQMHRLQQNHRKN